MHAPKPSDQPTSTTWLDAVRTRDPQAWRRLTDLYGPLVFHWGRRHGLSEEDARDLTQDVFSAVASAVDRFLHEPQQGTFRGWLWTIARNKLRDHFRKQAAVAPAEGGTVFLALLAQVPESWSDESQHPSDQTALKLLFRRALENVRCEFEEHTWQAFWMVTVDQRDTVDVASALAMSCNSVRQAKSRVLRRLRRELGDLEGSCSDA